MLVDKVLLEHQGLMLVAHHDILERADLLDEQRDLRTLVLEIDILAHARTKLLSLADVDDLPVLVFPQIHAGEGWHRV